MAGIHFDITGDNRNFINAIKGAQDAVKKANNVIKKYNIGNGVDITDSLETKIKALNTALLDQERVLRRNTLVLEDLKDKAKEAFEAGDITQYEILNGKINQQAKEVEELCRTYDELKEARDTLGTFGESNLVSQQEQAPRFYVSEDEYKKVEEIKDKISELQDQIAQFDGSKEELAEMRNQLSDMNDELLDAQRSATDAAVALGGDLGKKASEASTNLYELNAAVEEQRETVNDLVDQVNEAAEAFNKLEGSDDTEAVNEARDKYDALNNTLENAKDKLANLEMAQDTAKQKWGELSKEIEKNDSLMVKLLGGQEKFKEITSQLPGPLKGAVDGLNGMTGAAKAFIATPLGAVIAALILAWEALSMWFERSGEGQLALAKISGYLSGVLEALKDVVATVGKAIYTAFTEPQKAGRAFVKFLKDQIMNRLKAVGQAGSAIGKILSAAFSDNPIENMKQGLKDLANAIAQFGTGVEKPLTKVNKALNDIHKSAKESANIAVDQKRLKLEEAETKRLIAEYEKRSKVLEAKGKRRTASEEKELKSLKNKIESAEMGIINKKIQLQERMMDNGKYDTIEDRAKLEDLYTERANIEAKYDQQRQRIANQSLSASQQMAQKKAASRTKLFELEMRDRENEAKYQMELEKTLADLEIAQEQNDFKKEVMKREQRHKERLDAIKKQREEWQKEAFNTAKERWEAQNLDKAKSWADTETAKAGWKAQGLTETQSMILLAQEAQADEQLKKERKETEDALVKSHQSYIDKKLELDKNYQKECEEIDFAIKKASDASDVASVERLRRTRAEATRDYVKDQSRLSLDKLKADPSYVRAFEDLEGVSRETLQYLIDKFEEAKAAAAESMDPESLREYTRTIEEMRDQLNASNPFNAYKKSLDDVAIAEENLEKAKGKREFANQLVEMIKLMPMASQNMVLLAAAQKKVTEAEEEERNANDELQKSKKKQRKIEKEILSEVDELASAIKGLGNAVGGEAGQILNLVGDVLNFTTTAVDGIKSVTATGVAALSAMEKASVILTIISAAIQIMQQLSDIIGDSFSEYEKYAKEIGEINKLKNAVSEYKLEVMKARLEQEKWFSSTGLRDLADQWKMSGEALNNYQDLLLQAQAIYEDETGSGWLTNLGAQASKTIGNITGAVNKALGISDTFVGNLIDEAAKFGWANVAGGMIGMNMYLDDRLNKRYMDTPYAKGTTAAMNNLRIETRSASKGFLGTGIGGHSQRTQDLREWVKEKWGADLFDENGMIDTVLTQKILDKYGDKLVGETKETLEELKALKEQYDEYQQQLQEYISDLYSPLADNLVDSLYDWYNQGTDIMDNFKEYASETFDAIGKEMIKSLVNELIFDDYKEELKKLYTEYSRQRAEGVDTETALKTLSDGVMKSTDDFLKKTEEEIPVLQTAVTHLQEGLKERGLSSGAVEDKKATYNISDKVTYDQMDEFTGILRATQIAVEHGSVTRDLILANLETLSSLLTGNGTWGEIRNLIATSNDYLLDIKKSNRAMLDRFTERLDSIINKIDDLDI